MPCPLIPQQVTLFFSSAVTLQGKGAYLDVIHKYLEVHGTVDNSSAIPSYVQNHGIIKGTEVQALLRKSKVSVLGIKGISQFTQTFMLHICPLNLHLCFVDFGFTLNTFSSLMTLLNACM